MERQLKLFFKFLEEDKKVSQNTLQSYKRDLKQFRRYLEACEIHYNRVKEEDIKDYIKEMQEDGKKASSISRCIASIRSFYQFVLRNKKIKEDKKISNIFVAYFTYLLEYIAVLIRLPLMFDLPLKMLSYSLSLCLFR